MKEKEGQEKRNFRLGKKNKDYGLKSSLNPNYLFLVPHVLACPSCQHILFSLH
jgi:hypothetical protein